MDDNQAATRSDYEMRIEQARRGAVITSRIAEGLSAIGDAYEKLPASIRVLVLSAYAELLEQSIIDFLAVTQLEDSVIQAVARDILFHVMPDLTEEDITTTRPTALRLVKS